MLNENALELVKAEQMEQQLMASDELSEEALEAVAGGCGDRRGDDNGRDDNSRDFNFTLLDVGDVKFSLPKW